MVRFIKYLLVIIVLVASGIAARDYGRHAATLRQIAAGESVQGTDSAYAIRSGVAGDCMDIRNKATPVVVQLWGCNGSTAQAWTTTATTIRHSTECLAANSAQRITLAACSSDPSQVWLRDQKGYFNPATQDCLSTSGDTGSQLTLASCNNLGASTETWQTESGSAEPACGSDEGAAVVCQAAMEWTKWQAADSDHEALLAAYTAGTPDEEWCADFVSYLYKAAGYPFTDGSYDGWDENVADNIQYMGFTEHTADGSYTPKAGDVAYFDYPGGHVEIVISGGSRPTFIYGDSATIDPTTGNGQMQANTITQVSGLGELEYYLSPTSAS